MNYHKIIRSFGKLRDSKGLKFGCLYGADEAGESPFSDGWLSIIVS